MLRAAPVLAVLFGALAGLAPGCAGPRGPALCPGEGWCAAADEAARIAEPATGTTFTCPIGVHAGVAREAGEAPPAGVPEGARGTLDERATKDRREAGDAVTCCYRWHAPCPAGA
jgi:hypothetical protein